MWESLTNEEIYLNVASGLSCCMVCHIVRSGGVKGQRIIFAVFCCMQFFYQDIAKYFSEATYYL